MLILTANGSQDKLVKDLGLIVPQSPTSVSFSRRDEIDDAIRSTDLRALLTDNAFNPLATLSILDPNSSSPITQNEALAFLDVILLAQTGAYSFVVRDASGNPPPDVSGGSGLTPSSHKTLDTLVHGLSENHYMEVTRTDNRVASIIWWFDSSKLKKVREEVYTRSATKVISITTKQYDASGLVVVGETKVEQLTRVAGSVTSSTVNVS